MLIWLPVMQGCHVYSFTGTNISPDVKSISVSNFVDRSGLGPPYLSQRFSEKLRDYFQRNTGLALIRTNGDLQVEGNITGYSVSPVAPTAQQVAAQTRLTITVQLRFSNLRDEEQNIDQSFSFYKDFPANVNLQDVQAAYIDEITDQLILDIYNKTVANW
ncbi:MAG: LptE family protein [Bacteroidota bacterium]